MELHPQDKPSPKFAASFNGSFPHDWLAELLPRRPLILPERHFIYPREADEVERGALEVLVRPGKPSAAASLSPATEPPVAMDFLATCALGFRDPAAPSGLWSTPRPWELCAVSGGYAYLIDTRAPERFTMIAYRPVLAVHPLAGPSHEGCGLLLFVGHHAMLAWGAHGQAWESERLSSEGITLTEIDGDRITGLGWDLRTDREIPFALEARTGRRLAI